MLRLFKNLFLELDYYRKPITFTKNGKEDVSTYAGAFLSLCIFIVTIAYGLRKYDLLKEHGDTIH